MEEHHVEPFIDALDALELGLDAGEERAVAAEARHAGHDRSRPVRPYEDIARARPGEGLTGSQPGARFDRAVRERAQSAGVSVARK